MTISKTDGITSLETLRQFIHTTLCDKEQLLEEQSLLVDVPLVKRGEFCGMQFTLHGPRRVKLSAVWASDRNIIYLYDTKGERYKKVMITRRFELTSCQQSLATDGSATHAGSEQQSDAA